MGHCVSKDQLDTVRAEEVALKKRLDDLELTATKIPVMYYRIYMAQNSLDEMKTEITSFKEENAELRRIIRILAAEKICDLNSRVLCRDSDFSSAEADLAVTQRQQLRELKREIEEENGHLVNANLMGGLGYNVQTGTKRPGREEREKRVAPIIAKVEQQIQVLDDTDRSLAALNKFVKGV